MTLGLASFFHGEKVLRIIRFWLINMLSKFGQDNLCEHYFSTNKSGTVWKLMERMISKQMVKICKLNNESMKEMNNKYIQILFNVGI